MFVVECATKDELKAAMDMFREYRDIQFKLALTQYSDVFTITVEGEDENLCEMYFQMNYHQKQEMVCSICADQGEDLCGHLTFTKPINPAF